MVDPVAFEIGPLSVRWYGLLIALAFLIGIFGSGRAVRKAGLDEDAYYSMVLWIVVFALLGARLYYVLFEWGYYSQHPGDILAVWKGGLAIHGGILAGAITLFLGCRHYGFSFWQLGDIIAPFLILGQAIGRWGNYFNQEAYGYEVAPDSFPWAMYIDGAWRHPTFLYESLWNAAGFLFLILLTKSGKTQRGEVGLAYFMYYSLGRFVVEGFRTDSLMLGPLRIAQVVSVVLFLGALVLFIFRRWTQAKESRGNTGV